MSDEDKEAIGFIVFIVFIGLILLGVGYVVGYVCGNDTTVTSTRQTLCREFMKETSDYINCNTKGLNEIIMMIKGANQ
jgi:hypothetical protein